ncbi:MAG: hypothetical protein ACRED4_00630, partial [Brevundimonas sp.]
MVRLKRLWSAALGLSCAALLNVTVVGEAWASRAASAAVAATAGGSAATAMAAGAAAGVNPTCSGRFVNPITDVCWSCLFPLTLG